jgi:hypothetical protein
MIISTLQPLPWMVRTVLGMVVASWLLPTAPITSTVLWSADTTDMLQAGTRGRMRAAKRGHTVSCCVYEDGAGLHESPQQSTQAWRDSMAGADADTHLA